MDQQGPVLEVDRIDTGVPSAADSGIEIGTQTGRLQVRDQQSKQSSPLDVVRFFCAILQWNAFV